MTKTYMSMDGNNAAAHCAYAFTEIAAIYPITPSSTMAEVVDAWASSGRKNIFDSVVKVTEMQSEGGAAGAVHGALQGGALSTTFTASQGLLLMIPNIYKMAGELLPGVIHVAARAIAGRALSIFGDHEDIYAARQTGVCMLASHSVQEAMDLAGVAHLSAIKGSAPFIHFFDGFRTSHEIQKIEVMDQEFLKSLLDREALNKFKASALNPHSNPVTRGGAENDDIFFQTREAQNKHYNAIPDIVNEYMKKISEHTGREYAPFTYYGASDATRVIVAMGSVTETIKEVVNRLNSEGEKVGLIKVHLYRPFSVKYLKAVFPKTCTKIAVLDRTKEMGAREPLYLDITEAFKNTGKVIIGGRYGLSSKDTTPNQIKAVYDELNKEQPKEEFTIGIVDDVTHLSLEVDPDFYIKSDSTACLFYGLGSDGTVSANKSSIKIIGDNTDQYAQAYFQYDSKKAGGVTKSHLRFGKSPILSTYYVDYADFISCSLDTYVLKYDMIRYLKKGGTFLLNTSYTAEEIESRMPNRLLKKLADKQAKFYIINATKIANEIGMGRRTNTILQSAFFALNEQIMPYEKAVELMKYMAKKAYSKKGDEIVELNYKAIDSGKGGLVEVEVKESWKDLTYNTKRETTGDEYFDNYVTPINEMEGYDLPVSTFLDYNILDGSLHSNVAFKEKRTTAPQVPSWNPDNCIQCGFCSYVCPHGTIRTFLLTDEEVANAPMEFATLKGAGKGVDHLKYRIQVSPANCVGCSLCVVECPGKGGNKALTMVDTHTVIHEEPLADYMYKELDYKTDLFPTTTVKGSQFQMPYFEVSGACPGCGETPYYKLVTQLYGRDMLVANATGCSMIYSSSVPTSPFVSDKNGEGVAWGNSLFEDNAEYGYGMALAQNYKEARILQIMEENLESDCKEAFTKYIEAKENRDLQRQCKDEVIAAVKASSNEAVKELLEYERDLVGKSVWIIGGDGWAYDIGFGGLDHVIANDINVNVLILDTEVYSNTGGQSSKASPLSSIAKFAAGGKPTGKKDLGQIAMAYGHVYVAQVAMGANKQQTLNAFKEAESYPGPSLIIAYSPCIEHGIKGGLMNHQRTQAKAVECGYFTLYRFDPRKEKPLTIDSKAPNFELFNDFILSETRYSQLPKLKGETAYELFERSKNDSIKRYNRLVRLSKD
ncbi:pyruvate:ferredoxin (flavodoxin) oxidoreductase [Erysipelotrichaceae bacterium OH741_COT-311]|nr:pyruvate:ferredoxin (flavodoxin) oxidoreductase [Erysipelotrichaceae bacterium OH741_COT-311]